jgi:hypothetical protein
VNIQLLSDLHLEVHPHWRAEPAPGADVLVLAGDVGSYQRGSLLQDDAFGLAQFSPLADWPTPVFFVPGNHEYDGQDFDTAHLRLQATCQALGITWLERVVAHPPFANARGAPVRLLGTTLWSDFDALTAQEHSAAQALVQRDKAFRAANHYSQKPAPRETVRPFWRRSGARKVCCAKTGCRPNWRPRLTAAPSWSPTLHPACAAPTRAMATRPGRRRSATAWTR